MKIVSNPIVSYRDSVLSRFIQRTFSSDLTRRP